MHFTKSKTHVCLAPFIGRIRPSYFTQRHKNKGIIVERTLLHAIMLPLLQRSRCKQIYENRLREHHFCAGFRNMNKGTCKGDSGGPLVCRGKVIGILSFAGSMNPPRPCGQIPPVYGNVTYIREWIRNETGIIGMKK